MEAAADGLQCLLTVAEPSAGSGYNLLLEHGGASRPSSTRLAFPVSWARVGLSVPASHRYSAPSSSTEGSDCNTSAPGTTDATCQRPALCSPALLSPQAAHTQWSAIRWSWCGCPGAPPSPGHTAAAAALAPPLPPPASRPQHPKPPHVLPIPASRAPVHTHTHAGRRSITTVRRCWGGTPPLSSPQSRGGWPPQRAPPWRSCWAAATSASSRRPRWVLAGVQLAGVQLAGVLAGCLAGVQVAGLGAHAFLGRGAAVLGSARAKASHHFAQPSSSPAAAPNTPARPWPLPSLPLQLETIKTNRGLADAESLEASKPLLEVRLSPPTPPHPALSARPPYS